MKAVQPEYAAAVARVGNWVRLRQTGAGKGLFFANTRFDRRGGVARREAGRVIASHLLQFAANLPALLIGDLNITEGNPA